MKNGRWTWALLLVIGAIAPLGLGLQIQPARADAPSCPTGSVASLALSGGIACAIRPSATGPGIADSYPAAPGTGFGDHVVAFPSKAPVGAITFLVGSGEQPYGAGGTFLATGFLSEALQRGFVVIMPAYANRVFLAQACANDLACWGPAHQRVVTGKGATTIVRVDVPNGLDNRLLQLDRFLHRTMPRYAWPKALSSGEGIRWRSMYLGGLSFGGGTAAWIAQREAVAHLCLLSSVLDGRIDGSQGVSPTWIHGAFATSPAAISGLIHQSDPYFFRERANFQAMGVSPEDYFVSSLPEADPHPSTLFDSRLAPQRDRACFGPS